MEEEEEQKIKTETHLQQTQSAAKHAFLSALNLSSQTVDELCQPATLDTTVKRALNVISWYKGTPFSQNLQFFELLLVRK